MKTRERSRYSRTKSRNPFRKTWDGVPATVKPTLCEKSLSESFFTSVICHIIGIFVVWAIGFLLLFFGIAPKIFPKPKPQIRDIEFVLNTKRHRIRHIKTKKSAIDLNSTASLSQSTLPKSSENNKPTKNSGKNVSKVNSDNDVPDFAMPMPSTKSLSSGLGGVKRTRGHASGVDSSSIPSLGSSDGASSSGAGNSGRTGFDKNTTKKIISSYDISPYVNELKRDIRWNWKAPKDGSKRVELFLRIARDGKLIILNVKRTSESGEVDEAALNAVRKCLPLNPLPSKYTKNYLDLVFTFGSNFVGSRY